MKLISPKYKENFNPLSGGSDKKKINFKLNFHQI
jgi:hypothetical protein